MRGLNPRPYQAALVVKRVLVLARREPLTPTIAAQQMRFSAGSKFLVSSLWAVRRVVPAKPERLRRKKAAAKRHSLFFSSKLVVQAPSRQGSKDPEPKPDRQHLPQRLDHQQGPPGCL